jgi:D-alanyl-D-alanine-carboxypeptidase/D-alanyl-D-alanine-endopeptidase
MTFQRCLTIVLILAALFQTLGQKIDPDRKTGDKGMEVGSVVNTSANKFMSDQRSVGLSVGIIKDGRSWTFNFGEVEKGKKNPPTQHTIYELASITKTFTGVLLAQAFVEGKVKLDDDIRKYLDGSYRNLEFEGKPIKLFHLINHTSRLPSNLPDRPELFRNPDPYELPKILTAIESQYTKENFYADLHKVKLDKAPGTEFKYSNAAAQLLGYILEKIYGMPYEQMVFRKIARPLGMSETKITLTPSETKRFAKGHYDNGSVALYSTPQTQAAGGLRSSVSDMLKYMSYHLNENDEVVRLSHQSTWGDIKYYASGLSWQMKNTSGGRRKIWQTGGTFGFSSYCAVFPELKLGIVLLSNESDQDSQGRLNNMADEILTGILGHRRSG